MMSKEEYVKKRVAGVKARLRRIYREWKND
jgi:hypothetical protein